MCRKECWKDFYVEEFVLRMKFCDVMKMKYSMTTKERQIHDARQGKMQGKGKDMETFLMQGYLNMNAR